ncbi:hypothetical protein K9N50_10300 [bacterium]|nr:hypothetical protein [bacterium]
MRFSILVLLCFSLRGLAFAGVLIVPTQYESIQNGIDAAADSGDIVLVLPGEYTENINFNGKGVIVFGGAGADFTIINGGGEGPCVTFDSQETVSSILAGFTLTGGSGNNGLGGGVYVSGSMPLILMNTFLGNETDEGGAAVYSTLGVPTLYKNLFLRNTTDGAGAGINLAASAAIILNNTFTGNESGSEGAALYAGSGVGIQFINNIVVHNSSGRGANVHANRMIAIVTARYNDVWDNEGETYSNVQAGDGAISDNPLFVDIDNDDFHLTEDSPCIDTGDPDNINDFDGSRADMGCYSYSQGGNLMAVYADPDTINFGSVQVDSDSVITITLINPNEGDNEIRVGFVSMPGSPFSVEDSFVNINGGEEIELDVTFEPSEIEDFSDALMMISSSMISLGDTLVIPLPVGVSTIQLNGTGLPTENVTNIVDQPISFDVITGFPNPFNSTIELRVNLDRNDEITLQAFDINGRSISNIYDGFSIKGRNIYYWTPDNISAGSYIIRLTTSNVVFELSVQYLK